MKGGTVSLFVMAKNAAGVIERMMLSTLGCPNIVEVVLVANDCEDTTVEVTRKFCESKGLKFLVVEVRRETHPELYLMDTTATYEIGESLAGEKMEGPFTEALMLANWSTARNLGWRECTGDKILFMDGDDVLVDATELTRGLGVMDADNLDVLASRYATKFDEKGIATYEVFRERVARRGATEWEKKIHETLVLKGKRVGMIGDGMVVKDLKDSRGTGTRIANRNLKILYRHAREVGWDVVDTHYLANLVMETQEIWPDFACRCADLYNTRNITWGDQAAWVFAMAGEVHEGKGRWENALTMYDLALKYYESPTACFRAARVWFFRKDWKKVVEFYIRGLKASTKPNLFDSNYTLIRASKILYCSALAEMGKIDEAVKQAGELSAEFPASKPLKIMRVQLEKKQLALRSGKAI